MDGRRGLRFSPSKSLADALARRQAARATRHAHARTQITPFGTSTGDHAENLAAATYRRIRYVKVARPVTERDAAVPECETPTSFVPG